MSFAVIAEPPPLATTPEGAVRIGATRVTLDTLVSAFREGLTAEAIVEQYPSLRLADVYSVLGYILNHANEVELYLRRREQQAEQTRNENERRFDPQGIRDRLLARRA